MPRKSKNTFVAIDFETADHGRDSACAVGLVRVEDGRIVQRVSQLIRPPRDHFEFTHVHGIRWSDVASAPTFAEAWPALTQLLVGASFLAAHNASFDRSVLNACCAAADLEAPSIIFQCSMKLARQTWGLYPTKLPDVCAHLGIPLKHHDAASDAEACARVFLSTGLYGRLRNSQG